MGLIFRTKREDINYVMQHRPLLYMTNMVHYANTTVLMLATCYKFGFSWELIVAASILYLVHEYLSMLITYSSSNLS